MQLLCESLVCFVVFELNTLKVAMELVWVFPFHPPLVMVFIDGLHYDFMQKQLLIMPAYGWPSCAVPIPILQPSSVPPPRLQLQGNIFTYQGR